MSFQVRFLQRAVLDQRSILKYLKQNSPLGAAAWLNALEKAVGRISKGADQMSLAEENSSFDIEIRQALFKTRKGRVYRMVFTIVGSEARVLRIRGPSQDWLTKKEIDS